MKRGKKWRQGVEKIDRLKDYALSDAIGLVKDTAYAKFDETLEAAINLGVDARKSDQNVRGAVGLPNGLGKKVRILAFAQGEKAEEAKSAGADFVGGQDLADKITGGWLDFDAVVATPDMMKVVGKLGRLLGPHGLMPNPKVGTVTMNIANAIEEIKSGKVEFKIDKAGILHIPLGKLSFETQKLEENTRAVVEAVVKAKPTAAKGNFLQRITLSSTMGHGVKVDVAEFR